MSFPKLEVGVAAKPVRQVAESEGAILDKMQSLMAMIALLSMAGSSSATRAAIAEHCHGDT